MTCNANYLCSPRYGIPVKGVEGRGSYVPVAIVLHKELSAQQVINNALTNASYSNTNVLQSVHFVVDENGNVTELVKPDNTAWAVSYVQTSVTEVVNLITAPTADLQLIHIAYAETTTNFLPLATLICCLAQTYNITYNHIYPVAQIDFFQWEADDDYTLCPALLQALEDCSGVDLVDPEPPAQTAPPCCTENTTAITNITNLINGTNGILARLTALENANINIDALESQVATLENLVNSQAATITGLQTTISTLNNSVFNLAQAVAGHQACIDKLCPQPICLDAHYVCSQEQAGVNTSTPVIFCTKINDFTSPIILNAAYSSINAPRTGTYYLTISLDFKALQSCASSKIIVELVDCNGTRVPLHTEAITTATLTPSLNFSLPVSLVQGCAARIEWSTDSAHIHSVIRSEIRILPLP